ncbi:MAG: DUF2384 domain-containing protein [Gammaproteobacteria bacterium]|nr:DUF2384 domain-containing protein [Gammaproteobacteria bacterium]
MQPQQPRKRGGVSDRRAAYQSDAAPADQAIAALLTSGASAKYPNAEFEDPGILDQVRNGLPFTALENLISAIGAPQKEIAGVVGIPATTLTRRRSSGRLTPTESDHVVRVARLAAMASDLMAGDTDAARTWLTTPHRRLGDESPLRRASTETGGREVEQLIGQLRHGIFS